MSIPQSLAFTLVRVTAGLFVAAHGLAKVGNLDAFLDKNGVVLGLLAIAGELGGGLGVASGVLARVAGFGMGTVMTYIALTVHGAQAASIGKGDGAKFEYPLLLGVIGFAVMLAGPGPWTVGALLRRFRGKQARS